MLRTLNYLEMQNYVLLHSLCIMLLSCIFLNIPSLHCFRKTEGERKQSGGTSGRRACV